MNCSVALSPAPFGRLLTAMVTPFDADGQVDFAHNLSRVVAGLYEAQFDHWRGRVYGPSNFSEEITKEASIILGL